MSVAFTDRVSVQDVQPNLEVERAVQALAAFLKRSADNTADRFLLLNLLWAADRFSIREQGATVTRSPYQAIAFGPVASTPHVVMQQRSELKDPADRHFVAEVLSISGNQVTLDQDPGEDLLSPMDLTFIAKAESLFGSAERAVDLSAISRQYPEWKRFKQALAERRGAQFDIVMTDFFDDPEGGDPIFGVEHDQIVSSKAIFEQSQAFFGAYSEKH